MLRSLPQDKHHLCFKCIASRNVFDAHSLLFTFSATPAGPLAYIIVTGRLAIVYILKHFSHLIKL